MKSKVTWYLTDLVLWMTIFLISVHAINDKSWSILFAMIAVDITKSTMRSLKPE